MSPLAFRPLGTGRLRAISAVKGWSRESAEATKLGHQRALAEQDSKPGGQLTAVVFT
jgi:hypothetical protein